MQICSHVCCSVQSVSTVLAVIHFWAVCDSSSLTFAAVGRLQHLLESCDDTTWKGWGVEVTWPSTLASFLRKFMSDNIITTVITVVLLLREAIHQLQDPAAVLLVRTVPKLMGRLVFLQLSIQKCNTANCTANDFISHDESFHFPLIMSFDLQWPNDRPTFPSNNSWKCFWLSALFEVVSCDSNASSVILPNAPPSTLLSYRRQPAAAEPGLVVVSSGSSCAGRCRSP